jgi:hypothetical protein
MANQKTIKYSEPSSYFPEHIRKKNKIGEYAETKTDTKKTTEKKATAKKTK